MTPREFMELYIQERRGILRDRLYPFEWNKKGFEIGCAAMESLDIDCTDLRSAHKDVHAAFQRLYRIKAEKHLALFSKDPSPDDDPQAVPQPPRALPRQVPGRVHGRLRGALQGPGGRRGQG